MALPLLPHFTPMTSRGVHCDQLTKGGKLRSTLQMVLHGMPTLTRRDCHSIIAQIRCILDNSQGASFQWEKQKKYIWLSTLSGWKIGTDWFTDSGWMVRELERTGREDWWQEDWKMYKDGHLEVAQNEDVCFPCACSMQRRLSKSQDDKLTHSWISAGHSSA